MLFVACLMNGDISLKKEFRENGLHFKKMRLSADYADFRRLNNSNLGLALIN